MTSSHSSNSDSWSSAFTAEADTEAISLRGRVVLITGGSRGLGAAIAQVVGERGARVVLADLDLQRAQDRAALLAERDIQALPLPLDVGDPAQCRNVVEQVQHHFGRLDALVNNAAVDVTAPLAQLEVADWLRVLSTNLSGPLVMSKYAAALMAQQSDGGQIVNIASTASRRAWPNASAYHATKWGLLGLSHALHAELRDQGIRVCAVIAGGMRTPFLLDRFPDIDATRLQDPLHVARAVRYVLEQPPATCIPELMVLPQRESSWP